MITVARSALTWGSSQRRPLGGADGRGPALGALPALLALVVLAGILGLASRHGGETRRAAASAGASQRELLGAMPVFFERNAGQVGDRDVRFISRTPDSTLLLEATAATVVTKSGALSMHVRGADPGATMHATGALPGVVSYIFGRDRSKWRTGIATSRGAAVRDVYPGIDLKWYGNGTDLEYDFVVAAGADPRRIAIDLGGAERVALRADGDLAITMRDGAVRRQQAPVLYQHVGSTRVPVRGSYALSGHTLRFEVGAYDRSRALTIDPLLYSTLIGGRGTDVGNALAIDSSGNAYLAGMNTVDGEPDASVPTTPGAFQTVNAGGQDGFVAKFDPSRAGAASLVYATYLGDTGLDIPLAIAVDGAGRAVVAGTTGSTNFPITTSAFQSVRASEGTTTDAFVTQLNASGSGLVYSTFLGGVNSESATGGMGVAVDGAGRVVVSGVTSSTDFPTVAPLQAANAGGSDHFVAKLDTSASGAASVLWSTYLGGSGAEATASSLALDAAGDVFVAGGTSSTNFPGTSGSGVQAASGGGTDAFLTELAADGQSRRYATYLGGSGTDRANGVAVAADGTAYVAGQTASTNFPATGGAYQTASGGGTDAMVAKVAPGGAALEWATYLGGSGTDNAIGTGAIALGGDGRPWLTGQTASTNFPTAAPVQATTAGGSDAFVARLDADGATLEFSTYLGSGNSSDRGNAIALAGGAAYVAGTAGAATPGFPTTPSAFRETASSQDAFLSVINDAPFLPPTATTGAAAAVSDTSASVGGTVAPQGVLTSYVFEYGTSLAFGQLSSPGEAGLGTGGVPVSADLTGLQPSTTYYYRVVASSVEGTSLGSARSFRTTGAAQAPLAVTGPASSIGDTGATVAGQVSPRGQATVFAFEYGTSLSFGALGTVVALDDADAPEPVSATLTGLRPNTTYYFRVVAANATGTTFGDVASFTTTGTVAAPAVTTGGASAMTATGATLSGTVDPHGGPAAFAFEYGLSTAFGSLTTVDSTGSNTGVLSVSLPVSGLAPGTRYRYRIVATNAAGTTAGAVQTFTTAPTALRR